MLKSFELVVIGIACGLLGLGISTSFFLIFWALFVAIVVLAIWDSQQEIDKLRARIAELERVEPSASS